jgi:DNA N-6-adenine-methyltransferase (Dam)
MTLGSHQTSVGKTQIHITPRWIIERLGPFDLDPAAADPRPWSCAVTNYTERDDGLRQPWRGRVWLNPPFDRYAVGAWIRKLAKHGCGTTLLHARTEAEWFEPIWESAAAILFMANRLHFHRPDGTRQPANSGAPPILAAFSNDDAERLRSSDIPGALVPNNWTWRPHEHPTLLGECWRDGRGVREHGEA